MTEDITLGGGTVGTIMQNAQGVVIGLTSVSRGIDFRLAVSGMEVKLVE